MNRLRYGHYTGSKLRWKLAQGGKAAPSYQHGSGPEKNTGRGSSSTPADVWRENYSLKRLACDYRHLHSGASHCADKNNIHEAHIEGAIQTACRGRLQSANMELEDLA